MNKICCLFINHKPECYKERYEKMSKSVDYIDFYNINPDWEEIKNNYSEWMFGVNGKRCNKDNVPFVIFQFKYTHPEYDYYFVMENDVLFTGDYKLLFDELTKNIYDYDYMIQDEWHLATKEWCWLKPHRCKLIDGFSVENNNIKSVLYNFFYLKNTVIDYMLQKYKEGYYGHPELCMSCILMTYSDKKDLATNHFNIRCFVKEKKIIPEYLKMENTIVHPIKE